MFTKECFGKLMFCYIRSIFRRNLRKKEKHKSIESYISPNPKIFVIIYKTWYSKIVTLYFVVVQMDVPKMVSEKLIKAALQHLHVYLEARKHCK